MNMSYHALFFLVAYTMRVTPFDSFKVKWLNSHIFYDLYGCNDIGMRVGRHGHKKMMRGRNKQLSTKFEHQVNCNFMKSNVNEVWIW